MQLEAQQDEFITFPGFMRGDELYQACKWRLLCLVCVCCSVFCSLELLEVGDRPALELSAPLRRPELLDLGLVGGRDGRGDFRPRVELRVVIRLDCHPFYCTLTSSSLTLIVTNVTAHLMFSSNPASTLVCPRPRFRLRISLPARHSHMHALSDSQRVHAEATPLLLL